MKRWLPTLVDTDAVQKLPKRKAALELQDGKRGFFWGLLIREKRSDLVISLYVLLFNIPGLVFFFLWLFVWGHDSDLQNAAVPVLTSLSLTIGFVGLLYSNGHHEREATVY
jgi:fatty acid desaturase